MPLNKDIIIRVGLGLALFVIFTKIVGPVLFEILKRKIPGAHQPDNDIDSMIRGQKERMRSQYGINRKDSNPSSLGGTEVQAANKEIEKIYKESHWGGGHFTKDIQNEITKFYSYTLAETKVNAFILLSEKRHFLNYLNVKNQESFDTIKSYLALLMLFLILIEEIRSRNFSLLERVAKRHSLNPHELALALQLKILFVLSEKRKIKEDRLFEHVLILHQYSEDTMDEALDLILRKEANIWTKGPVFFLEELSLYLTYASILTPTQKVKDKKDITTAYSILNATAEMSIEEIKKIYKKIAMLKHPDKIGQMNLPKILEKKAFTHFGHIQEAYEIIINLRKK